MDLLDVYGRCVCFPTCRCRMGVWLGRLCHNWKPMGVSTVAELEAWHRAASTQGRPPYTTVETQKEVANADC